MSASLSGHRPPFDDPFVVYILKCKDGTYYVGCTSDIDERILRHTNGQVKSTKLRLPIEIIHLSYFPDKYKAFAFEKYLKSGSRRAFMNKRLV